MKIKKMAHFLHISIEKNKNLVFLHLLLTDMKKTKLIRALLASIMLSAIPTTGWSAPYAVMSISATWQQANEGWSYSLPQSIYKMLCNKNIQSLSEKFNTTIEITLPQSSGLYSKKQGEMILSDFFGTLGDIQITIDHERSVGEATSTICTCKSGSKKYRLYILTQNQTIQQLRIEEQNE